MPCRTLFALVLIFPIVACAPAQPTLDEPQITRNELWKTIEGCGGQELCSFATLTASEYNKSAGRPTRDGFSIRGATTDGRVVSVGMNVPDTIRNEPARNGRTVEQQIADALRKDLCGTRDTRRFFDLGGELRLSIYVPSGELFSKNSISSC